MIICVVFFRVNIHRLMEGNRWQYILIYCLRFQVYWRARLGNISRLCFSAHSPMQMQYLLVTIPLSSLELQVATINLQDSGRASPTVTELGCLLLLVPISGHIVHLVTYFKLVLKGPVDIGHLVEVGSLSLVHLGHHHLYSGTQVKQVLSRGDR